MIGVTTVEASETRGTTALVYCLIGSSLYTGTVQGWWSTPPTGLTVGRGEVHPNWSDGQQGRSQLSTNRLFPQPRTYLYKTWYRYGCTIISGRYYMSPVIYLDRAVVSNSILLSRPLLQFAMWRYWFRLSRYVYGGNRSFAPILRQSRRSLLYDVYWLVLMMMNSQRDRNTSTQVQDQNCSFLFWTTTQRIDEEWNQTTK